MRSCVLHRQHRPYLTVSSIHRRVRSVKSGCEQGTEFIAYSEHWSSGKWFHWLWSTRRFTSVMHMLKAWFMVGSLASVRVIQLSPGLGGRMGVFRSRFVSRKSELGRLETYVCAIWKWNDVIQIQGINCTCTRRHSQGICMKYGSRDF